MDQVNHLFEKILLVRRTANGRSNRESNKAEIRMFPIGKNPVSFSPFWGGEV